MATIDGIPLGTPYQTLSAQENSFYITAPNGQNVPVENSIKNPSREKNQWDTRYEVATVDIPVQSGPNDIALRALDGFDYARYGYILIGNVWVDKNNLTEIDAAWKRLESGCCTIL
jgi:hypothetical protein